MVHRSIERTVRGWQLQIEHDDIEEDIGEIVQNAKRRITRFGYRDDDIADCLKPGLDTIHEIPIIFYQ
jgi:hypothetical protein